MATRLATTRNNLITVTTVKNADDDETNGNTQIVSTNTSDCTTTADVQRTQITPVALHHVNLSQVKALIRDYKNKLYNQHRLHVPYLHIEKNYPSNGTIG